MTQFSGVLFDPRSGVSTKVEVRVVLGALEFVGVTDVPRVDISRVAAASGGWDRASLQLMWSGEGGQYALTTNDPLAASALAQFANLKTGIDAATKGRKGANRSGRLAVALLTVLVALPLLAILAIYLFRNRIIDIVLDRLPPSFDIQAGQLFEGDITKSANLVTGTAANQAVEAIVARLAKASPPSPFTYRVHIQRSKEVNAFAAPGGLIVVYTGLIQEAGSPEEVAGVLAHEMAHVTERHSMRQMLYQLGVLPLIGFFLGSPEAASVFEAAGQLTELQFSRVQEEQADDIGASTLRRARLSPEGMAAFFDRLARIGGASPPAILSTHPGSAERAKRIRERVRAEGEPPAEPFDFDWASARAAAK